MCFSRSFFNTEILAYEGGMYLKTNELIQWNNKWSMSLYNIINELICDHAREIKISH